MKKLMSLILAFIMLIGVSVCFSEQPVYASEVKNANLEAKSRNPDYIDKLLDKSEYLNARVDQLKKANFSIDPIVRSIKSVDFVYYSNEDNSIVGLIQVHKDFNSEVRVNLKNNEPETIEFIKANGEKMVVGKDEEGNFNKILSMPGIQGEVRAAGSVWWCPYVVGLIGAPISGLYSTIAGMIGGPVALIFVTAVNTVGWTWVSEQCP